MLTDVQIEEAADRLENNKLTLKDVDSIIQNFRLLVGSLESTYNWNFEADLTALDDSDGRDRAAKMAACLLLLIDDGFSVVNLTGKNGVALSFEEERKVITLFAFNLLYKTPIELTEVSILMNASLLNYSGSVVTQRVW